jgi:hypothetical protein
VTAAWAGSFELPRLAVASAHDAHWQLAGLTNPAVRVTGTGHYAYDTRDDASAYHYGYDVDYDLMIDDQRAIDGELRFAIAAEHTGRAPRGFAMAAGVTFAPDDTAQLVLDGTRRYQIALATGGVTALDALD